VRVGLAGPASLPRLLRFAAMCGVGNSLRALQARPSAITRLMVEAGPELALRELAPPGRATGRGRAFLLLRGAGSHRRWLRAVREGRFELSDDGGFRVGSG